jgi:lipoate-protein ligase A
MKGRIIQLGSFDAYTNMALDEAIFIHKEETNLAPLRRGFPPTLRFYSFKPPALSLGYFQRINEEDFWRRSASGGRKKSSGCSLEDIGNYISSKGDYKGDAPLCLGGNSEQSERHRGACPPLKRSPEATDLDIVRRITGGKAVFHNGELSYSFTASKSDFPSAFQSARFYEIVCRSIIKGLKFLGIEATLNLRSSSRIDPSLPRGRPFCLSSPAKYDIILENLSVDREERKLAGNAQRKRNGAILQQGSIFIKNVDLRSLAESIVRGFEEELRMRFEPESLSKEEIDLAQKLKREKYTLREWNYKR